MASAPQSGVAASLCHRTPKHLFMSSTRSTFFRQSAWLILATTVNGVFMIAVHMVASQIQSAEYAVFGTLLKVFLLMSFPAVGLQVIFTQQAAAAVSETERHRVAAATRALLQGTLFIWAVLGGLVLVQQKTVVSLLKISNPAALWITVVLGLGSLWLPILRGLLQGRQRFLGLGWVAILDGIARFTAVAFAVWLGGQAAGGMVGVLAGQSVALSVAFWLTREFWFGPRDGFEWRTWFRQLVPLTLASSSVLMMTCGDVVFVQAVFKKGETEYYVAGQLIGVALVMFTTPLAAVMFPKIVESAARAHRTDALRLALGASALIAALAGLACTLFPELPLRILFFRKPEFWKSATLVPWFAWALVPLILTNVLVNNLIARGKFQIAPWLALTAIGYATTLLLIRERLLQVEFFDAFKMVIRTLGLFSLLLLAISLLFTWKEFGRATQQDSAAT